MGKRGRTQDRLKKAGAGEIQKEYRVRKRDNKSKDEEKLAEREKLRT